MKELNKKEHNEMLRNLLYVSIISADNDEYTEEQKQEVISRHKISKNWDYILEPIDDTGKLAKLFKDLED